MTANRKRVTVKLERPTVILRDGNGSYRCLFCGLGHVGLVAARLHVIRHHGDRSPLESITLYPPA